MYVRPGCWAAGTGLTRSCRGTGGVAGGVAGGGAGGRVGPAAEDSRTGVDALTPYRFALDFPSMCLARSPSHGTPSPPLQVWDLAGGFCTHNFSGGHEGVVLRVLFHPKNMQVGAGACACVCVWACVYGRAACCGREFTGREGGRTAGGV